MNIFSYLFLIIHIFIVIEINCGKFEYIGRGRSSTGSSSFSSGFSDNSYCSSGSSVGEGRVALLFIEDLLESEYRNNFFYKIKYECRNELLKSKFLWFFQKECAVVHELFKFASRINLSQFCDCYESYEDIFKFNNLALLLNRKFEEFLNKKKLIYMKLCELIKNGMNYYLFQEGSEFLNLYKFLLKQNSNMEKYMIDGIQEIENYVNLISEEEYLSV